MGDREGEGVREGREAIEMGRERWGKGRGSERERGHAVRKGRENTNASKHDKQEKSEGKGKGVRRL